MTPPIPPPRAVARARSRLELRAAQAGAGALCVLAYAGLAHLLAWPPLPAATALAAAIGLLCGVLVVLQQHPRLRAAWAEMTAWLGFAFLSANVWNLAVGQRTAIGCLDVAAAAYLVVGGFLCARAAAAAKGA